MTRNIGEVYDNIFICCNAMKDEILSMIITGPDTLEYDTGEGVGNLYDIKYCWGCGKKVKATYEH